MARKSSNLYLQWVDIRIVNGRALLVIPNYHHAAQFSTSVSKPGSRSSGANSTYQNPILPGFHPDPSCIFVPELDDTFFCASSSFLVFPGIPIHTSKDLQKWKLVSNVLNRPEQSQDSTLQRALPVGYGLQPLDTKMGNSTLQRPSSTTTTQKMRATGLTTSYLQPKTRTARQLGRIQCTLTSLGMILRHSGMMTARSTLLGLMLERLILGFRCSLSIWRLVKLEKPSISGMVPE
jgi:hypothetical protein